MKKVTYQQIADALNISRVTVWKALNNKPGISPATRQSILLQAVAMGYPLSLLQDSSSADLPVAAEPIIKKQASGQTINVAVAVSRPETSNFWMSIIHYQAMTLAQNGINLIYAYLPSSLEDGAPLPDCLTNGTCQGLIVMNIYDIHLIEALNALPIQKVFLDCPSSIDFSSINGNLFLLEGIANTDAIVQHMIDLGKKRIHFIGDIAYAQTNRERHLGYLRAMQRNGLSVDSIPCLTDPIGIEDYQTTICTWLDRLKERPEAIVCASDYIAHQVVEYYLQRSVRIPEDILVSGYDDSLEFNTLIPLTTVPVNNARLGVHLAQSITNRIHYPNDEYQLVYIRSKPVFRASTGD